MLRIPCVIFVLKLLTDIKKPACGRLLPFGVDNNEKSFAEGTAKLFRFAVFTANNGLLEEGSVPDGTVYARRVRLRPSKVSIYKQCNKCVNELLTMRKLLIIFQFFFERLIRNEK